MPIRWCMMICLAWMTTICGGGSLRSISNGDEATAVLAGDALQTLAFELLTSEECAPEPHVRLAPGPLLGAGPPGQQGMVLGQALDIAAESATTPLDLEAITALQAGKTGALIGWSGAAGAVLAGADPGPLRSYASALGLAFQIADDLLDVTGDATATGKRVGKGCGCGQGHVRVPAGCRWRAQTCGSAGRRSLRCAVGLRRAGGCFGAIVRDLSSRGTGKIRPPSATCAVGSIAPSGPTSSARVMVCADQRGALPRESVTRD